MDYGKYLMKKSKVFEGFNAECEMFTMKLEGGSKYVNSIIFVRRVSTHSRVDLIQFTYAFVFIAFVFEYHTLMICQEIKCYKYLDENLSCMI